MEGLAGLLKPHIKELALLEMLAGVLGEMLIETAGSYQRSYSFAGMYAWIR